MKKILKFGLIESATIFFIFCGYLFIGQAPQPEKINWGVNFSQKQAESLGLDWQETYSALISELGAKKIKIATYWDLLEPKKDEYIFEDLDQQVKEAEDSGVEILLAIGMKTPRWPECHIPEWAKPLNKEEQQKEVLELIEKIVSRYQESETINIWQVENEPFFPFGDCPWVDEEFLEEEINLVKSLDLKNRQVLISDSGEGSFWFAAAKMGDIVGSTMYKKVWFRQLGFYIHYPLPPVFYWRKANLIDKLFDKEVICVELQAEPWGPKLIQDISLTEQEKTMNLETFKENIEFAKKTGLDTFYLWGGEWWYWLKEKEQKPEIWQEAQKLFQ